MTAKIIAGLGPMTGDAAGIILNEVVRRAIETIRALRLSYDVRAKEGYDGGKDVFTTADTAAQEVFVKTIRECFPNVGILGEEDKLNVRPKNGCGVYVTIDPIDGTRAFIRGQSQGVGCMVALVRRGKVLSAWIGDINTQEIYGFRAGSKKTHRISEYSTSQHMESQYGILNKKHILLRDPLAEYSAASRNLIDEFKSHEIEGGSIGIWFARLWKAEVGALLMLPGKETPWDSAPTIGISKHLGYAFLRPASRGRWKEYDPKVPLKVTSRKHDTLVIHEKMLDQIPLAR